VLCSVVLASRNQRHAREAREEAGRQLAAQQEREAATHRALKRTRRLVDVFAVLLVLAAASAVFGFVNLHRAHVAEAEAQHSRSNAEKLVSFLIEDFYSELEPTGRLDTLGKLAHMTVGYYDSLPPKLVTPQTEINRAMALVREGAALHESGKTDEAFKDFGAAQVVFEKLRAAGDHGEPVTYGLALTLYNQGKGIIGGGRGTVAQLQQAADLLRPLVYGPGPSHRVRQLYADDLNYFSHTQPNETAVATCEEARKVLAGLGAENLADLDATSSYADIADSEARNLVALGRLDAAQKLEQEVYELAEKVLAQRPNDLHSMENRFLAPDLLGLIARRRHEDAAAADYAQREVQAGEDWLRFDPSKLLAWSYTANGLEEVAQLQFERGDTARSIATLHSLLALEQDPRRPSSLGPMMGYRWRELANLQAETGDAKAAAQSMRSSVHDTNEFVAQLGAGDPKRALLAALIDHNLAGGNLQLAEGAPQAALATATATLADAEKVKIPANDTIGVNIQVNILRDSLGIAARAATQLGQYAQAEQLARRWLQVPTNPISLRDPRAASSPARAVLAHAIAMQGRGDEAREALQPALAYYEGEQKAGANGTTFRRDYAYALYVSAIAAPSDAAETSQRSAALTQAAGLIAGASKEAQQLADMRHVSGMIAAARTTPAG
jgi:hypothetical protein